MTLQQRIAAFICGYSKNQLRTPVWEGGKRFFTDAFGVMLAGCEEKSIKIARTFYLQYTASSDATVLGSPCSQGDPLTAARINGMACHVHDYDDNSLTLLGHPSCVVLPAVLAASEMTDASVEDAILAYILGVDVTVMLAKGTFPEHYVRGWHSTATLGIFGAAAACCKLLGLTEDQCVNALGLAASSAAGIRGNNGSMGKSFQAGYAAQAGLTCALLAQQDFTTNITAMDGGANYLNASSGPINEAAIIDYMDHLESEFDRPGMALKLYPCCKATHTSIDMARELRAAYGFAPDDVERVVVGAQPVNIDLLRYTSPQTKFEGKFSMNYAVALGIVRGNASLADFMGGPIEDNQVLAFIPKVSMELDPEIAKGEYSNGGFGTKLHVFLKDGRVLHAERMQAHGDPEEPVSYEEFHNKFLDCAAVYMTRDQGEAVFSKLYHPAPGDSVKQVLRMVSEALSMKKS